VANAQGPPTEGARERLADVNDAWRDLRGQLQSVLSTDVPAFNEQVRELGSEPVFVPSTW